MIKKIICYFLLIITIPYMIINIFIKDEEIKFNFITNQTIRVKREKTNKIEKIPFEQYIVGVLSSEMPVSFEIEALKAQAVAARSYALKKIKDNKNNKYDVVDTVKNQVYKSEEELKNNWKDTYTEKINKIKQAVLETNGEYLTYNGKIVQAFFFSTSVGKTENSEEVFVSKLPYLRSVDSTWDEESPVYTDEVTLTLKEFYQKLNLKYENKLTTEIIETTSTGRIKKIKINNQEFKGTDVATKLKLRSNYFKITQNKEKIKITTKGYGHGVGMSQYGANGMAKQGYKYREILKYYYQGTEIKKI